MFVCLFVCLFVCCTFRDFTAVHYDPTREDHEEFEQKEVTQTASAEPQNETQPETNQQLPQVSNEKFFDVNTSSLANLFGNQHQVHTCTVVLRPKDLDLNSPNLSYLKIYE